MNIVLFHPEELNSPLPLADQRVKHLQKILHKGLGDSFEAGIINGSSGLATITSINDQELSIEFSPTGEGRPLYPLTMIIGFPRPIQLKRLLRDIASLGVSQVHLCGTELGEKSYLKSNLAQPQELSAMLQDGSIQAKSTHIPQVFIHQRVADCLKTVAATGLCVALDNVEPATSLNNFLAQKKNSFTEGFEQGAATLRKVGVVAAIGSERGWTAGERKLFRAAGFTLCSMGERVLRTETAATTATSIILSQMEIL